MKINAATSLGNKGITHLLLLVGFVVIFAAAGVGLLVASHADATPCVQKTLKVGSKGTCVKAIQFVVNDTPGNSVGKRLKSLKIDGRFGTKTESGVKRWQAKYGLTSDGVVGRDSWGKLCYYMQDLAQASPTRGTSLGAKAQTYYNKAGCVSLKSEVD